MKARMMTGATVTALVLAGCWAAAGTPRAAVATDPPPLSASGPEVVRADGWLRVSGEFAAPGPGVSAVTYDQGAVPVGARIEVLERTQTQGTVVRLRIEGVASQRGFGVHVHTRPCGPAPEDSGPHYQNVRDAHQPSSDPRYANPANEVWLDLTTDTYSRGRAAAVQDWHFREGEANSVVIHEHHTGTAPGEAGTAGDRLACLTVPFESVTGTY